jgi:3-phosphoglycerate kinase
MMGMMSDNLEITDVKSIQGREGMANTTMIDKTRAIEAVAEEEVEVEEATKITEMIKDKIIMTVKTTMTSIKVASQTKDPSSKLEKEDVTQDQRMNDLIK